MSNENTEAAEAELLCEAAGPDTSDTDLWLIARALRGNADTAEVLQGLKDLRADL